MKNLLFDPPTLGSVLSLTGLPSGGSKIHDSSPYGNTSTITGATWKRSPSGLWCLSFDGLDDEINCGSSAIFDFTTEAFSVDFWYNPASSPGDNAYLINRGVYATDGWYIWFHNASGELQFYTNQSGATQATTMDTSFDAYHYIVLTRDGDTATFYKDGVDATKAHGTHINPTTATRDLLIGAVPNDDFKGIMSMIRIYNRALSALEIQNNFNREKHIFGVW